VLQATLGTVKATPTLLIDYEALCSATDHVVEAIRDAPSVLNLDAFYTWVDDIVGRSNQLVEHLEALRLLSANRLFAPAFSTARTALEAHVLNSLVRHSRKFNETMTVSDEMTDAELEASVTHLRSELGGLADVHVNSPDCGPRTITISWQDRPEVEVADDSHQSPYYQFAWWFNGTVPAAIRERVNPNERSGGEDDDLWRRYLTWKELVKALGRNHLAAPEAQWQLMAHYAFLSRFTHPASTEAGSHGSSTETTCALYACAIASAELTSLADYVESLPHHPERVAVMRTTAATARELSAPLRLFGDPPTQQDIAWSQAFPDDEGQQPEGAWLWIDQIKRLDTLATIINSPSS